MRHRATKAQKRYKRSASTKDYEAMAAAAGAVVIDSRGKRYRTGEPEYVLFTFPHWVKFVKGFPKGYIVEKTVETNTYKINAVKLLNWLYKEGKIAYDSKMLVKQTREYELLAGSVNKLFDEN